ncbi:Golgi-associated plant pathogenesis-related protein 1 [Channa argus]|uniref:Golgi-associated plant pathogenesis-related protein 1 n=1 Tax=Channa argus TaxID=215402 RepID=A0A6G1Q1E5_CHAAH|nr:Golgi-associated plant pathogenesis-related protein 1 [Channa argus]
MTTESFQQEFLKTHNAYRAKHSAPALKLNAELNASAQSWANHLLATGTLQHSDTKDGENIFTVFSSASLKLTGHFTQVVWKDTTEVGVGMASSGNRAFVVGQYRKPGNMAMPGYFEKNVLPLDECACTITRVIRVMVHSKMTSVSYNKSFGSSNQLFSTLRVKKTSNMAIGYPVLKGEETMETIR